MKLALISVLVFIQYSATAGGQILYCPNRDITISVYETKKGNITFRDHLHSSVGPTSTYPVGYWDEDYYSWVLTTEESGLNFEIIVNEDDRNLTVYKRENGNPIPFSTFLVPCEKMNNLEKLEWANGSSKVGKNENNWF